MIRKLVKLAIFLLIANAVYRIAPVSIHYFQFKDALDELALFQMNSKATDAELTDRVMAPRRRAQRSTRARLRPDPSSQRSTDHRRLVCRVARLAAGIQLRTRVRRAREGVRRPLAALL